MTTQRMDARMEALVAEYLVEYVHIAPVNNSHQPFIRRNESGDRMRCVLCSTDWMTATDTESHVLDNYHFTNFRCLEIRRETQWSQLLRNRHQITALISHRAALLTFPRWKLHVQGLLYEYITSARASPQDERHHLGELGSMLEKYEMMERLSLLELAVWKASRDIQEGDEDQNLTLEEVRVTNGAQVIIPRVLEFL